MSTIQNIYDDSTFFEGYKLLRHNDQGFNHLLEEPSMISLLPDLEKKAILDIGCGFGHFAQYAMEKKALSVLGIDASYKMLEEARKQIKNPNVIFHHIAIENFESPVNSFDLIVSSLAFHYVDNFKRIIKNIMHWLKPNGCFIFSVEHPICTANPESSLKTNEKGQDFYPVYNYRDEKAFYQKWFVEGVQKFHRTLSTYINTLIECELKIDYILEPMPSDNLIEQKEQFAIHKIRPPLLFIKSTKAV